MKLLDALLHPRLRLLAQEREIAALRIELSQARAQLESTRAGMRRCLSCDYRLSSRTRQERAAGGIDAAPRNSSCPAGTT